MKKVLVLLLVVAVAVNIAVAPVMGAGDWDIFRLESLGIIDNFDAAHIVTRAEAVGAFVKLMLGRAVGGKGSIFADVPGNHPYADEVNYAAQIGMVSGVADGIFQPDEPVTGMQVLKMAVTALGYQEIAEQEGGYEEGYKSVALKQGLVVQFGLYDTVTMGDFAVLLDTMLDMYPLEPVYGTDKFEIAADTIYEKILQRTEILTIKKGIVTAVDDAVLNGYKPLRSGEISIDGTVFAYAGEDAFDMLGKSVDAYYIEDTKTGSMVIVSISPTSTNQEIALQNREIGALTTTQCTYYTDNTREKTLKIRAGATFLYNRGNFTPAGTDIALPTGDVRFVDNDGDGTYDVVVIDEYESFIVDRISTVNTALYFKKDVTFRGKTYFKFDFDDKEITYIIHDGQGTALTFEDIALGDVVTIRSNMDGTYHDITVSDKTVSGVVTQVNSADYEMAVDDEIYSVYRPNQAAVFSDYQVGSQVMLYLNYKDEIVGGDVTTDGLYGYVIGAVHANAMLDGIKIQMIPSGTSNKEIEITGEQEVIKYTYHNGDALVFDTAPTVRYTGWLENGNLVTESNVDASSIDLNSLRGAVIRYRLNNEGEINRLEATPIDFNEFKASPKYDFNGKLNSFGGLSTSKAFLIGSTTNVICMPDRADAQEDDYFVDVTVTDQDSVTIVGINVDEETQIAECALLMAPMSADDVKPFTTEKYSIVGRVSQALDAEGDLVYKLEVLTGEEYKTPYSKSYSLVAPEVAKLKCGDLILYNTNSDGEIANLKKIASMYEYGGSNVENLDGTVFGTVSDVQLNRLDDFMNEMVDIVTFDNLGGYTKSFKLLREEGPVVYSYRKATGMISIAETDEIMAGSEIFLYVNDNEVKAVVIFHV